MGEDKLEGGSTTTRLAPRSHQHQSLRLRPLRRLGAQQVPGVRSRPARRQGVQRRPFPTFVRRSTSIRHPRRTTPRASSRCERRRRLGRRLPAGSATSSRSSVAPACSRGRAETTCTFGDTGQIRHASRPSQADDSGFAPLFGVGMQTVLDGALVRVEYQQYRSRRPDQRLELQSADNTVSVDQFQHRLDL